MRPLLIRSLLFGCVLLAVLPVRAQTPVPSAEAVADEASLTEEKPTRWDTTRWTGESGWPVQTSIRGHLPLYGEPFVLSEVQALLHQTPAAPCVGWSDNTPFDAPGSALAEQATAERATPSALDAPWPTRMIVQSDTLAGGCIALVRDFAQGTLSELSLHFRPAVGPGWTLDLAPPGVRSFQHALLVGTGAAHVYASLEGSGWTLTTVRPDGRVAYRSDAFVMLPGIQSTQRSPAVTAPAGGLYTLAQQGQSLEVVRLTPGGQEAWRAPLTGLREVSAVHALSAGGVFVGGVQSGLSVICGDRAMEGYSFMLFGADGTLAARQPVDELIVRAERDADGLYTVGVGGDPCAEFQTSDADRVDAQSADRATHAGAFSDPTSPPTPRSFLRTVDLTVRHVRLDGTTDRISRATVSNDFSMNVIDLRHVGDDLVLTTVFDVLEDGRPKRVVIDFAFSLAAPVVKDAVPAVVPEALTVQVHPNPVRGGGPLNLAIAVPERGDLRIEVFDVQGRRILEEVRPDQPSGALAVSLPTGALASGIYIVRADVGRGRSWGVARLTVVR